ncbi:MAG: hypothetical protein AB1450_11450 [Pseudomonadota bacterium]
MAHAVRTGFDIVPGSFYSDPELLLVLWRKLMGQEPEFVCPKCGTKLVFLLNKIKKLKADNANLSAYLREAEEELEHLGYSYIASTKKQTFHKPGCKWATYILDSQNYIEFSSHREAEEAGYKPCKTCCA